MNDAVSRHTKEAERRAKEEAERQRLADEQAAKTAEQEGICVAHAHDKYIHARMRIPRCVCAYVDILIYT